MADQLYVHFKLSDQSVQTILGVLVRPYPDSYLTKLVFNHSFELAADDQGFFRVDEDPQIFTSILNFYRHGQLILPYIFASIRESVVNKYLLPVEIFSRIRPSSLQSTTTTTTYVTYVYLRGSTRSFISRPLTEHKMYKCTLVDPLWPDIPESRNSCFSTSTVGNNGNQYVLKSFLTVMNWLIKNGYEVEQCDEIKQKGFVSLCQFPFLPLTCCQLA